jgi:adenylylsulfate kinase
VAKLFADSGIIALSSFISPYVADRDQVRACTRTPVSTLSRCSLTARSRPPKSAIPKGLYKKARAGEIKNFTGIDDPYEAPEKPEIHLHSDQQDLDEEVAEILAELGRRG